MSVYLDEEFFEQAFMGVMAWARAGIKVDPADLLTSMEPLLESIAERIFVEDGRAKIVPKVPLSEVEKHAASFFKGGFIFAEYLYRSGKLPMSERYQQ